MAHTCFSDMDIIGDWIYTTNRIILWRDRGWDQDWAMGVPVAVSPEDHVKRSQYEFIDHICYDIVYEDLWSHGSYYIYIYIYTHYIYTHILISSLPFYLHMMYPWIPEYWHSHPHPQGEAGIISTPGAVVPYPLGGGQGGLDHMYIQYIYTLWWTFP